jgi:hypothetical protein
VLPREILNRLDAHTERSNEHMARGNELMDDVREELRLSREFREREAAEMRELMRRHEVSFKAGIEVIEENRMAMQEVRASLHDQQVEIRANTRWVEVQTKAMLSLIDEIRGGSGDR